jgi:predicted HTH domain antitoxin
MSEILNIDHQEIEYELKKRGNNLAVFFHGGHMRADLWLGEDVFVHHIFSI